MFACLLILSLALPCLAAEFENPPVTDGAGFLTDDQVAKLSEKLEAIRQKYDFEVAVVTEEEMSGYDEMETADDIYDYSGFGGGENDDGILFYISENPRAYWFTTHADGERVFNQNGIDYLISNILPALENNSYYRAMDTYADIAEELLDMAANGKPYNEKELDTTYVLIVVGCALIIPLIIAWFMMSIKLGQMKTAVENDYAANYIKPGSKNLTVSRDMFLFSRVTKTAKPKNNSGSHQSSSGRTHGGGGGRF